MLKTELNNAVTNTVIQQLGTNGSGAVLPRPKGVYFGEVN